MAIPDCIKVPALPPPKDLPLPGGVTLGSVLSATSQIPDPTEMAAELIGKVNTALTPLIPVFNILDAVVAIFECLKAVTNPPKLAECLAKLAEAIDKLLGLLPQVSLPKLIIGIIDCLIAFLKGIKNQLQTITRKLIALAESATRAAELGDAKLQAILDCAEESLQIQVTSMNESFAPLNRLIGLVNALLGLIGLPELPNLGSLLESGDPEKALIPLDKTIQILTTARNAIPLP